MDHGKRRGGLRLAMTVLGAAALVIGASLPAAAGGTTYRASVSSSEVAGNGGSGAVTQAGSCFVVFESDASNLVGNDTNGVSDIFLRNRCTGTTIRVSVGNAGQQANGPSHSARGVSPDGRFIVFESFATNLVSGDTNGQFDVFLRDRFPCSGCAGKTFLISKGVGGVLGNGPSADPVVSADGRFVAYESGASNLVSNDTNGWTDVFLRDRSLGKTYRLSVSTGGVQGNGSSSDPAISANGTYVVFESRASNLIGAGNDGNGVSDIFLRNRSAGTTTRMSVSSGEAGGNGGSYSADVTNDGCEVAFESFANNLVSSDTNGVTDVFVRNRCTGTTVRVSVSSGEAQGNGYSSDPSISSDGNYVAFESAASNFTATDTNAHVDVFIRNRSAGTTICGSLNQSGSNTGNAGASSDPSLSDDGQWVGFESAATNLVANDTQAHTDAFTRGPLF